jgi:transposase
VALHAPLTNKVSQHRLDGGDTNGLLALIARKRGQAEEKLGRPVRVVCCFEAGYDGFWPHRWLCARGIENRVLDAASLLVNRRARRAKTDRLDAAGLLRTLMMLERGEAQVCRVVHVPTPAQEDARRRSRERARLIVERGQHTSRIKGLLMTQGIRDFEPTRPDWQARFEALRTPDGLPLAPCLRAELLRECRRLWLVMEMIAQVEAEQKAIAEAEDGPAARLAQPRGIGLTFATVLGNEVFFRAFCNRREVGGCLGLAPSPWQSGGVRRDQGIAKAGNPRARRTAIELAWLWLRHQPESALTRWFHERVGSAKGRMRRIMLVAMARKLIVSLWRYVTAGLVPDGAVGLGPVCVVAREELLNPARREARHRRDIRDRVPPRQQPDHLEGPRRRWIARRPEARPQVLYAQMTSNSRHGSSPPLFAHQTRACPQLSQIAAAARWMPARKHRAVLS